MISNQHEARTSFIINISRPLRLVIKRFSIILLFIAAFAGIFISNNQSEVAKEARVAAVEASTPITSAIAKPFNFVSDISGSFKTYLFVHSKNAQLVEENRNLRRKLISLINIKNENQALKDLLAYVKDIKSRYISAKVVGNMNSPFQRSLILNVGSRDDVKKGQAVMSEHGLIGRIIEIGSKSSRVLLLNDINSNIPVISSKTRTRAIMSGNNSSKPRLMYLPKDTPLENDEILFTSGDGDIFPPDLQIGTVEKNSDDSFLVKPFAKWQKLEHLSVIEYVK